MRSVSRGLVTYTVQRTYIEVRFAGDLIESMVVIPHPYPYHPPKLSAFNQWIHVTKRQLSIAQNMEGECVSEMCDIKEKDKTRITETGEERIPKTVRILVY